MARQPMKAKSKAKAKAKAAAKAAVSHDQLAFLSDNQPSGKRQRGTTVVADAGTQDGADLPIDDSTLLTPQQNHALKHSHKPPEIEQALKEAKSKGSVSAAVPKLAKCKFPRGANAGYCNRNPS